MPTPVRSADTDQTVSPSESSGHDRDFAAPNVFPGGQSFAHVRPDALGRPLDGRFGQP